jgi:hypothetical protein
MKGFRFVAIWVVATGLLMGVSFGMGVAKGKGDAPAAQSGMTQQQIQQLLGGGSSSGGQQQGQQGQGPGGGPVIFGGPAPGP